MRTSNQLFGSVYDTLESPFLDEAIRTAAEPEAWGEAPFEPEDVDGSSEALDFSNVQSELEATQADLEDEGAADCEAEAEVDVEHEAPSGLAAADTIDEASAQTIFAKSVSDRVGRLPDPARAREASAWNATQHPKKSGIAPAALLSRLGRYVNRSAIEKAMQDSAALRDLSRDAGALLAVTAHQFQQKIFTLDTLWDGKIGEGTLDALGFIRHRDAGLNRVDSENIAFHVKERSRAFRRLEELYKTDKRAFQDVAADLSPTTWFAFFVNPPFLGRSFGRGVHVELMRRLRRAEAWLLQQPPYRGMTPVQLGAALGVTEQHAGGRIKNNTSMHTLGLAVDIGYIANPWVAGQSGSTNRNATFHAVSRRVARLMSGRDDVLTPQWLYSLGNDPNVPTASAHAAIRQRHDHLVAYLALETAPDRLRATIEQRRQGAHPEWVIERGESMDAAVQRWRNTIRRDRASLWPVLEGQGVRRDPAKGFMNLHRDLVVALRNHGCLAWGAIDLGRNESGDMMHFDCRTEGIGWKLSLPTQRTVGAGHPIRSRTGAQEVLEELEESQEFGEGEELETPPASRPPTPPTSYRGGRVWTFTAKTLPMSVAVFCPKTVSAPKALDVLVYAHGHLSPCPPVPKTMPEDIITKAPFELGKIVDASNRHVALVVPFMDWGNLRKNKLNFEACNRDTMHALGVPANLNGVVREALGEIGRVYGTATPSLQHLILAGHSRAYDFLNPLAIAHVDPEMSRGCLARLSEVWALDTTYVCYVAEWMRWLSAKKPLRISVFYRPGTATAACGKKLAAAAARAGGRLVVTPVPEGHCQVPVRRLPALLNPTSLPAKEVAEEMGEMMEAQEEEALEEALVNESEETLDPEVAEVSSEMADEAFGSEVAGDAEAQDALASDEQAVGEGVP